MKPGPKRRSVEERFWKYVDKDGPDGCWLWTGRLDKQGRGRIGEGGRYGSMLGAHRVSFEIAYGRPVGEGLKVRPTCGNSNCVRPEHLLESATQKRSSLEERFCKNVSEGDPNDCWLWKGCENGVGYGVIHDERGINGRMLLAHRVSFERAYGRPIKDGMMICHHCDTPACVNPAHLYEGTAQTNADDKVRRNRHPRGEMSTSAKLTSLQVLDIRDRCNNRGESTVNVAKRYKVAPSTISKIKNGARWTHV